MLNKIQTKLSPFLKYSSKYVFPLRFLSLTTSFNYILTKSFSSKDDAFWEEYSQRKAQGGKVPALESQEIFYNKTIHSWKFSDKHSLTSDELISCLRDLENNKESPFVIVDVREEVEYDLYKLPSKTKKGVKIPIFYREQKELNHGNFEDIPMDKYVICIDSIGLRGRTSARLLTNEGYLTLYVEGGYDMFIPLAKSKEF